VISVYVGFALEKWLIKAKYQGLQSRLGEARHQRITNKNKRIYE